MCTNINKSHQLTIQTCNYTVYYQTPWKTNLATVYLNVRDCLFISLLQNSTSSAYLRSCNTVCLLMWSKPICLWVPIALRGQIICCRAVSSPCVWKCYHLGHAGFIVMWQNTFSANRHLLNSVGNINDLQIDVNGFLLPLCFLKSLKKKKKCFENAHTTLEAPLSSVSEDTLTYGQTANSGIGRRQFNKLQYKLSKTLTHCCRQQKALGDSVPDWVRWSQRAPPEWVRKFTKSDIVWIISSP